MSNALGRDLMALVRAAEDAQAARGGHGRFGQLVHVMPPTGWINDPNGLVQTPDGTFHAFFQYAPFDVAGGVKLWGHAVSRDLLTWDYLPPALLPDAPYDCHGAYSGSALAEDGLVRVLYTGNVKLEELGEDFDYVDRGREAATVLAESADGGRTFAKRRVMGNADYPADLTCHVRDPKVWRAPDGGYLMVQGARRRVAGGPVPSAFSALHGEGAGRDVGEVLVFRSPDLVSWELAARVSTRERFGFMWECPDYLELARADGSTARFLSVSPQGLEGGDWERRNIYQSGYFPLEGDIAGACSLGGFHLLDAGFDFYAPQTFEALDGRRVLIGWMGMPDDPSYGNDPTVAQGWQHCLSLPREVTVGTDGLLRQLPVRELAALRGEVRRGEGTLAVEGDAARAFDLEVTGICGAFEATFGGALSVRALPTDGDLPARLELAFASGARESASCGRTVRWESLERLEDVRIVGDASSVEVFANGGALCMSTRYYPDAYGAEVRAPGASAAFWPLSR